MKVLITFFPIDDMGGIINHHEQLCAGLKELGHEVTTKLLMWRDRAPASVAGGREQRQHSGLLFDQRRGFSWNAGDIIPYKGDVNLAKWKDYANQFDLIIWQVAVPTKRKENRGNIDWLDLYNVTPKQLAVIHDGNFLASYPWLSYVGKRLAGLACVHECAYNSARHISVPSAMILNPFEIPETCPWLDKASFMRRYKGFLSVQTWKAWKRVPELLAAIPHMRSSLKKYVAGKGIDYYYLTSEDKCKYPGVWDAALAAGMQYTDVISNQQRDALMQDVTLGIDASWSHKYSSIGAHFNRVQVEAILQGAMPVVRDLAIRESKVFTEHYNCLVIPWDATPPEFGHYVDEYANLGYDMYAGLIDRGWTSIRRFDRKSIASEFLALAQGWSTQMGATSDAVWTEGGRALVEFFNDRS